MKVWELKRLLNRYDDNLPVRLAETSKYFDYLFHVRVSERNYKETKISRESDAVVKKRLKPKQKYVLLEGVN